MSAQHTPWTVRPDFLTRGEFYIADATGTTVASGFMRKDRADLCAAAPDLLEAARRALAAMVRTKAPDNEFTDAVDALDAAIAKAKPSTGEKS